jgi:sulfopyruvate decarboxylase subunit alpha
MDSPAESVCCNRAALTSIASSYWSLRLNERLQALPVGKIPNLQSLGLPFSKYGFPMDVNELIHAQLVKAGVRLAASLPDDWVNSLIRRVSKGNEIRHVPVGREAETIAICAGAFFGGVRSVAIMGNTGLLTCTGEMATLCLRHAIPVFCIVSARGSIDDHKVYQEVQGRRTIPLLQAYDYPYKIIDKTEEIETIPDAYEWHRLQKRPFVLFLTKKLLGVKNA